MGTGMGVRCFRVAVGPSPPSSASTFIAHQVLPAKLGHVAWLSAPVHGSSLRHRAHGTAWSPLGAQNRTAEGANLAYQSQEEAPSTTTNGATATGPPPELFQNALSALDLFSPSASTVTDNIDTPEEIAVDHGQTAASVGRAIYEVWCMHELFFCFLFPI